MNTQATYLPPELTRRIRDKANSVTRNAFSAVSKAHARTVDPNVKNAFTWNNLAEFDRWIEGIPKSMQQLEVYPGSAGFHLVLQNEDYVSVGFRGETRDRGFWVTEVQDRGAFPKNLVNRDGYGFGTSLVIFVTDPDRVLLLCKIFSVASYKLPYPKLKSVTALNITEASGGGPFPSKAAFEGWLVRCVKVLKRWLPMPALITVTRLGVKMSFDTDTLRFVVQNSQKTMIGSGAKRPGKGAKPGSGAKRPGSGAKRPRNLKK
jgi:hypothetical protein